MHSRELTRGSVWKMPDEEFFSSERCIEYILFYFILFKCDWEFYSFAYMYILIILIIFLSQPSFILLHLPAHPPF